MTPFDGVDIEKIKAELVRFVDETKPRNASSANVITARSNPECGRVRAIELVERVRPILNALYPDWRAENAPKRNFEFAAERDASMRLLARIESQQEIADMLGSRSGGPQMLAGGMHDLVWSAASAQWSTGHRHEAVLAASKAVNSLLQVKVGRRDISETKLVREAFSDNDPAPRKARLRFPDITDKQTRDSMQQGVMGFAVGCFQAIRNPLGHLPNDEVELSEQAALERLAALSLLARWIDEAQVETAEGDVIEFAG